jgi:hypothetical protein
MTIPIAMAAFALQILVTFVSRLAADGEREG